MRIPIVVTVVAALALAGCEKEQDAAEGSVVEPTGEEPAAPADERDPAESAEAEEPEEPEDDESPEEDENPEDEGEDRAEDAHPIWPDVDLAQELRLIQGTWKVRPSLGGKAEETWVVDGDQVTITGPDGAESLGKLAFPKPGEVAVKIGSTTSKYAYARDGEDVWIGLGTGGVRLGDHFYVGEDRGVVVMDGGRCHYHDEKRGFGGSELRFEEPVEVKCSYQEGKTKAVVHYETPVFMKDDEREEHQAQVAGRAILNDQLRADHRAERVEDDPGP